MFGADDDVENAVEFTLARQESIYQRATALSVVDEKVGDEKGKKQKKKGKFSRSNDSSAPGFNFIRHVKL